ncbi:MAG: DNA gyrase inhibitor YacG [Candidatus Rokubacteria bacterium]|nr:DNA gyrase inhibitor YacG [Candidatus Rokubacteria bacterium]
METDRTLTVRLSDSPRALPRCPACRREVFWQENPHRPFCSITCRLIDLGVWLDEGYRIPGAGESPAEEASAET